MSNYPPGYDRDAHETAMGHDEPVDPDAGPPLTAESRLEWLVRLGMQTYHRCHPVATTHNRTRFAIELRERMAQAAQAWTMEAEDGK